MYCENLPFLYFFTSSSNLRLFNFKNIVQKNKQAWNKLSSELRAVTLSNIMTNSICLVTVKPVLSGHPRGML